MGDVSQEKDGQEKSGVESKEAAVEEITAEGVLDAEKEYEEGWKAPEKSEKAEDKEEKGLSEKTPLSEKDDKEDPREKALKDTKAWATRLSMENADLKKTIEAFKAGKATEKDVDDAHDAVAKAKSHLDEKREKLYTDYPELKEVLEPLIESNRSLEKKITTIESSKKEEGERERHQEAIGYFNEHIKPEVVKVHPDFDEILTKTDEKGKRMVNDEYFEWAEKQSPALRFAALQSSDPQDIIFAVTEFKKFKGSDEAKELKTRQEKERKKKITNAMSLRGGGPPIPAGKKKGDPDDYDAGWEEGGRRG